MKERSSSSAFWWLAAVSALVAIGIHFYLTRHHLDLQYGTSDGSSICNINQQLDCDSVNTSTYSEIFGAPLALWGAVANAAMLLLLLWARTTGFRNAHLTRICFGFAGTIALASLVMLAISFTQLGTYCLFCILTYVFSFTLFFGVAKMAPLDLPEFPETIKYLFRRGEEGGFSYLVYFAVIPVIVFLFNGMFRANFGDDFKALVNDSVVNWSRSSVIGLDISNGLHLKDPSQQYKMHIVEFADFGCPHCRSAAPTLHAFAKARKDVQFTFMNYPLDGNCNPAVSGPGHTCGYAKAAYCGSVQNKGWEAHDWLFENFGTGDASGVASAIQLDEASFKECLESSSTHEAIMKQATEGKNAGVRGTPSIFVNGKPLPRGQLIPVLSQVYNSL